MSDILDTLSTKIEAGESLSATVEDIREILLAIAVSSGMIFVSLVRDFHLVSAH